MKHLFKILVLALCMAPSIGMGQQIFYFDTYNPDDAVIEEVFTPFTLTAGLSYQVTVEGTYSVWRPSQWYRPCGYPESSPMYPSANGYRTGTVGFDFAYAFAFPDPRRCSGRSFPHSTPRMEWSLDDGTNWEHPADIPSYNPSHAYTYLVVGQGFPLGMRYWAALNSDDYGQLKYTVAVDVSGSGSSVNTYIDGLELNNGLSNALKTKISNAVLSFENGECTAAVNQLNAFINQVNAQRGKSLSEAEADELMALANALISAIQQSPECTMALAGGQSTGMIGQVYQKSEPQVDVHELDIFPNPADNTLHMRGVDADNGEYLIYSLDGSLLLRGQFGLDQPNVDVSDLLPGIYLLQLVRGDRVVTRKWVKQ